MIAFNIMPHRAVGRIAGQFGRKLTNTYPSRKQSPSLSTFCTDARLDMYEKIETVANTH